MLGFYNYTVILTYCSAVSAAAGVIFAMNGRSLAAVVCLMVSGVCDMFDGTVAKTRERTQSEKRFGVWIDSLTDVVAFGVLPAAIGFSIGMRQFYYIFVLAVFILTAIIRLAYYGVTEDERKDGERLEYDGLPVTSSALIFPLLYCFRRPLGIYFAPVYSLVLAVTALLFVSRFKLRKLHLRGLLILLAIGLLIFLALLIPKVCCHA